MSGMNPTVSSQSLWMVAFCLLIAPVSAAGQDAIRVEETEDHFKRWLERDVVYIITPEERSVFEGLTTFEEKEEFIEQFWRRRDSDPRTSVNEFKEEHYRRVAFANERFASGQPGWTTDRGRIYIIHGPPDEIRSRPSGGHYQRRVYEGGGTTLAYPFEVWRYRHIEGIGPDVELEFVDPGFTGEYRLALDQWEKDALHDVAGRGLTLFESLGLARKSHRRINRDWSLTIEREKDNPFTRYQQYVQVQRPVALRHQDLREFVAVDVSYDDLPLKVRSHHIRINEDRVLVPLSVELENSLLTFREDPNTGLLRARLAIYGMVSSITNRVVTEFDDDVEVVFTREEFRQGIHGRSLYQKNLNLVKSVPHKVDLVVHDLNSGKKGTARHGITDVRYNETRLSASSLILSDFVRQLLDVPKTDQMFVIGDVWVRPNPSHRFSLRKPFGVYLQIYNARIDESLATPSLEVVYEILHAGEVMFSRVDSDGDSIQYYSDQRVVLMQQLGIERLKPGQYQVRVTIRDLISGETVSEMQDFDLADPMVLAER